MEAYAASCGNSISKQKNPLLRIILLACCWLLLIIAAAQPQWIGEPVSLPTSGRNLMLAVDISGSMETRDMELSGQAVDRLTIVKSVVSEFVERRTGDQLGLILFGSQAYLQTPLTFDRETLNTLLLEARIGFAGEKTAIGDAIGLTIKRLQNRPAGSRVLILLTDGANTSGEVKPLQAAKLAQQLSVRIYTIGVGADEMIIPGLFGSSFGSRRTNPSADLDEDTLQEIATLTEGHYFRARDRSELSEIYRLLDELEPVEQEAEAFRPIKSLFYWPLGLALALSGLFLISRIVQGYLISRSDKITARNYL